MKYQCKRCKQFFHRLSFDHDFNACTSCAPSVRKDYDRLQQCASARVSRAIKDSTLTRLDACELCGENRFALAHHANGYDNPLDVWWLCHSCHGRLRGRAYHRGLISKGTAWKIIQAKIKRYPRQFGRYEVKAA